jgi:hypothetical protein
VVEDLLLLSPTTRNGSSSKTSPAQVQDDAGTPRMSALPVSSQTVVAYLGYLLESDTISAKSLQPYLSTINTVHNVSTFELRSPIAF